MSLQNFEKKLKCILDEKYIRTDEPMDRHTTFKVGGKAKFLASPVTTGQLTSIIELSKSYGIEYTVIGNGSNLLVKDTGYDGIIIKTTNLNSTIVMDTSITAECGVFLSSFSKTALDHGLTGAEFLSGIPGTIGGAVTMNAGAYNSEIKDIICSAVVLNERGQTVQMDKDDLLLSYRKSIIQSENNVVLSASFILEKDNCDKILARMKDIQVQRSSTQPLNLPNAGSIFKRINGQPVGAIIEEAGLKNAYIGGAKVSEKHANFIVNTGNASASDIIELINLVKRVVKKNTNIELETEIKIIG